MYLRECVCLFLAIGSLGFVTGKEYSLPDSWIRCHRKDPNLNQCLQNAVQKADESTKSGVPELQMFPTDPMDITAITIQNGAGRPVNIKLNLTEIKAIGLTSATLANFRADLDKRLMESDTTMNFAVLEGKYDMDGKFLVLPLKGHGNCRMEFTGMKATIKMFAEPMVKKGKSYWNVVKFDIKIKDLDKLVVNFDNLFNGDKVLGDNTNKVLNENWRGFWEELKPTFEDSFSQIFLYLAKQCFDKVPEDQIFLDD